MDENQSIQQKIISLTQSEHAETVILILKRVSEVNQLVGDTDYKTIVNAVTFDAQQNMILKVLELFESVKNGSFINNQ